MRTSPVDTLGRHPDPTRKPRGRSLTLLTVVTLGAAMVTGVQDARGQRSAPAHAERAAIESLWLTLDSAWNARDAERFSSFFSEDVSFEFVDRGQSFDSRAAIHQFFADRFPGFAADLRHRTTVRDVRVFNDDVYVVDGTVHILRKVASSATLQLLRTFSITAVMDVIDGTSSIHVLRIYLLPSDAASQQSPGSA